MVGSIALGSLIGSVAGPLLAKGLRWIASKTRTKRDDKIANAVAEVLEANPEILHEIIRRIR